MQQKPKKRNTIYLYLTKHKTQMNLGRDDLQARVEVFEHIYTETAS